MPDFTFTVRAVDNAGAYADRDFTITVQNTKTEKFVAVNLNHAWTSQDGITWTARTNMGGYHVAYGNGQWVITGSSTVYRTSPDGIVWTNRTLPSANYLRGIMFVNGYWWYQNSSYGLFYSADAITWQAANIISGPALSTIAVVNTGLSYTLVGDGTYMYHSSTDNSIATTYPNGSTISTNPNINTCNGFSKISGDPTTGLTVVAQNGIIGRNHNIRSMKIFNNMILASNTQFGAGVSNSDQMVYSQNGLTWQTTPAPTLNNGWTPNYHYPNSIAVGNGYVVVAPGMYLKSAAAPIPLSYILTSTDGINYTQVALPAQISQYVVDTQDQGWVAYSNGTFVVGGDNNSAGGFPVLYYCNGNPSVAGNWKATTGSFQLVGGQTPITHIAGI